MFITVSQLMSGLYDDLLTSINHAVTNLAREAIGKKQPLSFRHPDDPVVSPKPREPLITPQSEHV